jgi:predicted anti-sigma-YlaC factor YlaD
MGCGKFRKQFHLYIDGYLSHGEEDILFAQLDVCEDCRQYYDDISFMYENLEEADAEPPYGFSENWRYAVEEYSHKKRRTSLKVIIPAVAACVCGLLVVTTVFGGRGSFFSAVAEAPSDEVMNIEVQGAQPQQADISPVPTQQQAQPAEGGICWNRHPTVCRKGFQTLTAL